MKHSTCIYDIYQICSQCQAPLTNKYLIGKFKFKWLLSKLSDGRTTKKLVSMIVELSGEKRS